ncbi:hypothetical protein D2A34_24740 [Clostridium chromiireducens]|uniref:Uncharacterized protein n=1 Tax=Clostridium chromiireducens TaxID=225345 RepID=A0A399IGY8_9CLOT|nr:hypothetical protein [Clostridium chromiireducens]RII32130.1 hypothetical protein D2A34_24740 [Clostridium chromiireducens]
MKVINKKTEREKEAAALEVERIKKYQAANKLREESIIPKIKIVLDWRLSGEYDRYMENKVVFAGQVLELRNGYFRNAINNRKKLKNIIVEGYERTIETDCNVAEFETDNSTVEALQGEANQLGMSLDEYVRGIFYTTAYEVNQERKKKKEDHEAYMKEHTPYNIGASHISQELKRKLDSKYGEPKSIFAFGVPADAYTNMLIDLAEEYFEIKK